MNDRIKKLAEQVVGPSRLFGGEFALMGDNQVEKFASLIIEECAQAADTWMEESESITFWVGHGIKEHFFGFEE